MNSYNCNTNLVSFLVKSHREVLGVEIGARSLVEILPVVRIKSD